MHSGFYDVRSGSVTSEELKSHLFHLHDLLKRIILKLLDYEGTYQPTVSTVRVQQNSDWIRPDTNSAELGY